MEYTYPSGLLSPLTDKQREQINTFETLLTTFGIRSVVNEPLPSDITEPVACDVEHDEAGGFVGIGVYLGSSNTHYWISDPSVVSRTAFLSLALIAHNGLSDISSLREWGFNVSDGGLFWDTMLMGHILDSSLKAYGLKDMARRELGIEYPSYDDIVGKRGLKAERVLLDRQPPKLVQLYNALDCYATHQLYLKQIKGQGSQYKALETPALDYFHTVELPAAGVFKAMETRGIRVDLPYLRELKDKLEAQQRPIKEAILNELGPINLNSPPQLLKALKLKGIEPILKGKPSTAKNSTLFSRYGHLPLVQKMGQYSELATLLEGFCYPYLERNEEYVHPFFNQVGTRTGRPSCSNPNLLQIPKRSDNGKLVRRMFIPREGMLLGDCDYSAIEPRVMAHLSKDPALCALFNDGVDFHQFTANKLGISRDRAKILNLSVGYRATFKSVAQQLKCSDKEAQNEINNWWGLFPTLRRWQDGLIFDSKRSGFCTTLLGRRIRIEDMESGNSWRRESAERQLINNITQGSAAEVMKLGMIAVHTDSRLSAQAGLLIQVYDQLVFESPDIGHDLQIVVEDMEKAVKLIVPLVVDAKIGPNWAEVR